MILAAGTADSAVAFLELGVVFLALSALAWSAGRLEISPIPFYLVGGLLVGPGAPLPVDLSTGFTAMAADIGVLLLLFALGLEYTVDELGSAMRRNAVGGVLDLLFNGLPGLAAGFLLGWGVVPAILLGGVTYISSSGVIAKLVGDLGRIGNRETPSVLTLLVLEDLAMAVYLPVIGVLLAGAGPLEGAVDVVVALSVVAVLMVGAAVLGRHASSLMSSRSAEVGDEVVLLSVLGLVLVVGGLVQQVDVSAAVGAFLVGVAISGPAQERAAVLIGPLRDLFAALFFFLFALSVDPSTLPPVLPAAAALAAVGVLTKVVTGWVVSGRAGIGVDGRWRAGTALVARGEFSIVIAGLGVAAGAQPDLGPLAAAYVLILAVLGPLLARPNRAPRVVGSLWRRRPARQ